jgi:integrase
VLAYFALRNTNIGIGPHWEDVDLDNRIITVRTRVTRLGKGVGLLVREDLKTQPEWRIVMRRLVADVLRKRSPRQLEARLAAGLRRRPANWLHLHRSDRLYFATVRTRAGLVSHRFRGLRRDFASLLLAAGVADRVVMAMMGHSSMATIAKRYQHVPDELQRLAADRLDDLLQELRGEQSP